MATGDFAHLHLHTQYSFLDGANHIEPLMERASRFGMKHIAVTDHGHMCGALDFYSAAKKHGINPIIGMEAYVAPGSRLDQTPEKNKYANHLILLASNETGYRNLCRISTNAFMEGFYRWPRVDKELLARHSEGIIALSACLKGEVSYKIQQKQFDEARQAALDYDRIFGRGNFFLEIQENGLAEQKIVNDDLMQFSRDLGIPLCATGDCHYLEKDQSRAHKALMAIGFGKTLAEMTERDDGCGCTELWFKDGDTIAQQFSYAPEAVANSLEIASRCNFEFKLKGYHPPTFSCPDNLTAEEYFEARAREGLDVRLKKMVALGRNLTDAQVEHYRSRLNYETGVIKDMGFAAYFLIVSDFTKYAKSKGIPVGPGRGSAAGSLAAYALEITDVDPIPYDLLFERFLNPQRKSMPDIDMDFCEERRGEVISYVSDKYGGRDRVAQIITYGKLKAKAVVRDVGRVLNVPLFEVNQIAGLIPNRIPEKENPLDVKLEDALKAEPRLKEKIAQKPEYGDLMQLARTLEGLYRQASKHAAGVVIADRDLTDYLPLYLVKGEDVVTQFDMKGVEKIGLIKFDFLGLKTLTLIHYAERAIRRNHQPDFSIYDIPLDDRKTFDLISSGDNVGIFQIESEGMKDAVMQIQPHSIAEISDLLALYRPGPMENIPMFADRKFGRAKLSYLFRELEPILGPTQGIIVYQEQIMQICQVICGMDLGQADLLRRAIGKKDQKAVAEQCELFTKLAVERGFDKAKSRELADLIAKFANYGFNKSHSVAYAFVTYQTAYLKANYPVEFMAALLTIEARGADGQNKTLKNINQCQRMGIEVLPPDVNESDLEFTGRETTIRFGLEGLRGVGTQAAQAVIDARKAEGRFRNLYDLTAKIDSRKLNRKVMEALVQCGAMDSFGRPRRQLFESLEQAIAASEADRRDKEVGQGGLFGGGSSVGLKESYAEVPEWPNREKLQREREVLGVYLTGHPLREVEAKFAPYRTHTIAEALQVSDRTKVRLLALCTDVSERRNKRGELFANARFEDPTGVLSVFVGAETWARIQKNLYGQAPDAVPEPVAASQPAVDDEPAGGGTSSRPGVDRGPLRVTEPFLLVGEVMRQEEEIPQEGEGEDGGGGGGRARQRAVEVRATDVLDFDHFIERYGEKVVLSTAADQWRKDRGERLVNDLRRHRGDASVMIEIALKDGRVAEALLPADISVPTSARFLEHLRTHYPEFRLNVVIPDRATLT